VTLSADTQLVRLRLPVPAGIRPMRAELIDADLVEQLRRGPLAATPDGPAASVTLDIPASSLAPGDYVITLRPAGGARSPAFTYAFRVVGPR
jgi:hypothetical protein